MKEVKFSKKQKKVFEELGVSLVYVFGSQIDGTQNKLSDIDVGVVFDKNRKKRTEKDYTKLFDVFTDVFREYRKVDLIFLQDASLMLQSRVVFGGKLLYQGNDELAEVNYKEFVMKRHADTQYFRDMRQKAILERI